MREEFIMRARLVFVPLAAALVVAVQAQNPASAVVRACSNCGVVESVHTVQRQEPAKGIAGTPVTPGMAIGGVVGGVVGNQVGRGGGRTAATVLGAAGGAYAGHALEKNRKRHTVYVMRVRMRDGSLRTVEQAQPIARGTRVALEGHSVHVLAPQAAKH